MFLRSPAGVRHRAPPVGHQRRRKRVSMRTSTTAHLSGRSWARDRLAHVVEGRLGRSALDVGLAEPGRTGQGAVLALAPTEPMRADAGDALLGAASSMLLVHIASRHGWCLGCADLGGYAVAPCPAARQALTLVETHGVAVWDARPAASVGGECGGVSLIPLDANEASLLSRAAV